MFAIYGQQQSLVNIEDEEREVPSVGRAINQ